MCPLPSEMNTPPYYRDLAAAPMGSPFMAQELGTGFGYYGGIYPMYGMYGGYFPPHLYGVRLKSNPSRDMFVKPKEDMENKNNLKKFLKYAGIVIGSLITFCFLKGKIIDGAVKKGGKTFWTELFGMDAQKYVQKSQKQGYFKRLFSSLTTKNKTP